MKVNHITNLVDEVTNANTQLKEKLWWRQKIDKIKNIIKYSSFYLLFFEYLFKKIIIIKYLGINKFYIKNYIFL